MPRTIKFALVSFVAASFLLPSISFAEMVTDVDTSGGGAASTCVTINNNVSYRNRMSNNKEDVMTLQDFLNGAGYLSADSVTGFFGRLTEKAVIRFQSANGLTATPPGFVGAGTRAKIHELSCTGSGAVAPSVSTNVSTSKNLYWIDNTNKSCSSPREFSGLYMYQGLQTFNTQQDCLNTVNGIVATPALQHLPKTLPIIDPCTYGSKFSITTGKPCLVIDAPQVFCTMEARLCEDGSTMFRDASCGWHPEKCTQAPIVSDSVSVTSVSTNKGLPGSVVTIKGSGFTANGTSVFLNDNNTGTTNSTLLNGSVTFVDSNTLRLKIPTMFVSGCENRVVVSGTFKNACDPIAIAANPGSYTLTVGKQGITSNSLPFTITGSIETPTGPVVLSPNGGETFNQTSRVTVTWKESARSASTCPVGMYCAVMMVASEYEISLVPFDPSCITGTICKVPQVPSYGLEKYATGSTYSFTVASSFAPEGMYKIKVCDRSSLCDVSDSYFKIVGNTVVTPTPVIPVIQPVPVLPFKKPIPTIDPCFNDIKSYVTSGIPCAVIDGPQTGGVLGVSTMCVDLPINMHRGAESNDVKNLQVFLISKGLLTEDVSGFYGDSTVTAVRDYQLSKDLPVTGMVFDFTREMIRAESCKD